MIAGNAYGIIILTGAFGSLPNPTSTGNVIAGNYIGTNPAGSGAVGNTSIGIEIESGASGNWIGVNTVYGAGSADEGNVISGNSVDGIWITGTGTSGNSVAGNIVGLTAAGTAALANGNDGILINGAASATTIGGTVSGARNIISGNDARGVEIDSPATDNLVEGNYIGTDSTGTVALGDGVSLGDAGVLVSGGGNTFGGTVAGAGNVIAASGNYGIRFTSSAATGNVVEGNDIGTNAAGTAALPNANNGINIDGGASNNTIGGQGSERSTTPTATLTGLDAPDGLAFDSSGNLFVSNYSNNTVSEFAPGSTTPTATLTGLYGPTTLVFDRSGNLFVANDGTDDNGTTVSEFARATPPPPPRSRGWMSQPVWRLTAAATSSWPISVTTTGPP